MKKTLQFSLFLFSMLLVGCSQINYDHPLDSQVSYDKPGYFEDEDGDGLANLWDPDHEYFRANLDTTPPVITLIGSPDTVTIPFRDPENVVARLKTEYSVTDDKDETPTVVVNAEFSVEFPGTKTITYTAYDDANHSSTVYRTVIVLNETFKDTIKPTISVSPTNVEITLGDTFDPMRNVSAFDVPDGDLKEKIVISGTVNTNQEGEYTLTYTVKDKAENVGTLVRKIKVSKGVIIDNDNPVITLTGSLDTTIELNAKWVEPGYKAVDPTQGDITSDVKISGGVGSEQGRYSITYTVTDNALHTVSVSRIVQRGKPVDPIITLKNKRDTVVTIAKGATFRIPELTVVDPDKDEKIPADSVKFYPKFDTNVPGTYDVTLVATDSDGNSGLLAIKVIVGNGGTPTDTDPPVITIKGKNPDTVTVSTTSTYKDSGATAKDDVDGVVTVTTSGSVDRKTAKKYTINYIAKDKAGNSDTASRIVVVVAAKPDTTPSGLLDKYKVPRATYLPTTTGIYTSYETDGIGAPDLSKITKFTFGWTYQAANPSQSQINQFSINLNSAPYYTDWKTGVSHNFNAAQPKFTIESSGVTGLDGEYYINVEGEDLIWVEESGKFAIIWKQ